MQEGEGKGGRDNKEGGMDRMGMKRSVAGPLNTKTTWRESMMEITVSFQLHCEAPDFLLT